jgi:hypothetical protein
MRHTEWCVVFVSAEICSQMIPLWNRPKAALPAVFLCPFSVSKIYKGVDA